VTDRGGPGELTIVAVAALVTAGYALARAGQTGIRGAAVVGVFALAVFVLGLVWPIVALRDLGLRVESPRDAVVGDEIELTVHVTGRVRRVALRTLDPPGQWYRADVPGTGTVLHVASRRGVFRYLRIEVRSGGPLGVMSRRKVLAVELPAPVVVGPKPIPVRWVPTLATGARELVAASARVGIPDVVRSVRPYEPGDPARLVHWPSSARAGDLVVRELEPPAAAGLAIVVDLRTEPDPAAHAGMPRALGTRGGGDDAVEIAASRAAGLGRAVLAAGARLLLATSERGGPVLAEVEGTLDLSRRLARAVPGPPPRPPAGWSVETVTPQDRR
jgi:uncharacterized protein (DUF58 family)